MKTQDNDRLTRYFPRGRIVITIHFTRMHSCSSYVACMLIVCTCTLLVCTRVLLVCTRVTRKYSYVARMLIVCTRSYLYELVCYSRVCT